MSNLNDILDKGNKDDLTYNSLKVGDAVLSPVVSKHRTINGKTVKVNMAAIALEKVLKEEISVLVSDDGGLYFEDMAYQVNGVISNENVLTLSFGARSQYNTEYGKDMILILAGLLWGLFLSSDGKTVEIKNCVRKIRKGVLANLLIDKVDLLEFCDSYKYTIGPCNFLVSVVSSSMNMPVSSFQFAYTKGAANTPGLAKELGLSDVSIVKNLVKSEPLKESELNSVEEIYKKARNGDYILKYSWTEEQKKHIPPISFLDEFLPNRLFVKLLNKIQFRFSKVDKRLLDGMDSIHAIANDFINSTVNGRPASGKTKTLYAVGAALGLPVYTVAQSKRTEEDEYQGKNKVSKGVIEFKETNFLKGFVGGGIVILEELNLADAAVTMGALGQAIEFPFVLEKDGYEEVRRHPHCVIFSTMNVGTYGTKPTSQALSSRHRQDYILDDPKKEDFIKILKMTLDDAKLCNSVYKAYSLTLAYLMSHEVNRQDIALSISLRCCQGALQNIEEGSGIKEALEDTLVGKVSEFDIELAQEVSTKIISVIPTI